MTRPDQGLSLSLAPGGRKKRDTGNEVGEFHDWVLDFASLIYTRSFNFAIFCNRENQVPRK